MNFNDYQQLAIRTAIYPAARCIDYPAVGLANEAGEVLGKVKKVWRGDFTYLEVRDDVIAEMGDCQWYLAALARDLGTTLEEIAKLNLDKLLSRQERGTLRGNGDTR